VVINKVQNIKLSESYISSIERYADSQDVRDYSKPQYLFSIVEMGFAHKRVEISFRIQSSLESLFMDGLESNWRVPIENSEYFKRHLSENPVKSKEKILELMLSFKLF
jgi:hypothetical protein